MNNTDAIERAYRNGYEDGVKTFAEKFKEKIRTMDRLVVFPSDIENLKEKLVGGNDDR